MEFDSLDELFQSTDIMLTSDSIDAADYMAVVLQRAFPEVMLEMKTSRPWRIAWHITLPAQAPRTQDVELLAFTTMEKLYFDTGYLVGYSIQVEKDGE